MDLNKVAGHFKRAWANAGRALNVKLPEVQAITQSRFPDEYDVSVVFDQHVTAYVDTFTEIGCVVDRLEYNVADLKLPAAWLAAPTRLVFLLTSKDNLHNALLDAGIGDWLDLRYTTDHAALEVEFLDHPTAEQIAALKRGYDVLTFDELVYTFVERTSKAEAAPEESANERSATNEDDFRDVAAFLRKIMQMPTRSMPSKGAEAEAVWWPTRELAYDHGLVRITISGDYVATGVGTEWLEKQPAAPLVDPAKAEAKVRQCWAGGYGGKIAMLEAQADPREFIVTTVKPVPANANLRNHGLALVKQIAPEVSHVRVMDELWAKLLQKPAATTDTTEAATVADGDTQPISEPEFSGDLLLQLGQVWKTNGTGISTVRNEPHYDALVNAGVAEKYESGDWAEYTITPDGYTLVKAMLDAGVTLSDSAAPELDDRDVELNALRTRVGELEGILRAITPVSDEWQTLKITLPKDGKIIAHPEIAAEQAKGWKIHHVQYAVNGEYNLFVFMERRAVPQYQTVRYATAGHHAYGTWKGNGNGYVPEPTQIIISNGARSLADSMIDAMDDEIAPSMNALASALGFSSKVLR